MTTIIQLIGSSNPTKADIKVDTREYGRINLLNKIVATKMNEAMVKGKGTVRVFESCEAWGVI